MSGKISTEIGDCLGTTCATNHFQFIPVMTILATMQGEWVRPRPIYLSSMSQLESSLKPVSMVEMAAAPS